MRFTIPGAAWLVCLAAPAFAQSPYVAVGVGADMLRTQRVEAGGIESPAPGGNAISVSARGGTAITDRWGVEVEFTHAAAIEREVRRGVPVPLLRNVVVAPGPALFPVWNDASTWNLQVPTFESTTRISRRHATLDAVLWVAQPVGSRVDLIYLGGLAFTRASEKITFQFAPRAPFGAPIVVPNSTETTTYGTGPVAGVEARIQLTSHILVIPGVRLHGVAGTANAGGGWLVRPAVAAGWRY